MPKVVDSVNQQGDTADQVFDSIHELMHLYRAQRPRGDAGAQHLPHMEAKVLGYFARHPGATQSDLAADAGRDKSQLARLVAGLRERRLLDAHPDETDRRSVRLQLTADGEALHRAMRAQVRKRNRAAVQGIAPAECRHLLELLARIRANLEQEAT